MLTTKVLRYLLEAQLVLGVITHVVLLICVVRVLWVILTSL
jgi:hypothetical protein